MLYFIHFPHGNLMLSSWLFVFFLSFNGGPFAPYERVFWIEKNSASREKRRRSKEAFPGLVLQWWDRPMSQTRKSLHSPVVKADHRNEIKKQRIDFAES